MAPRMQRSCENTRQAIRTLAPSWMTLGGEFLWYALGPCIMGFNGDFNGIEAVFEW